MFALLKQSDARAVRRVLHGQRDQFDTLVKRYLPAVYAVSYAQLRNHSDAEDVTQEAFLAAFTSLHTLREPHKFEGWVVSMARRIAVHLRQKNQHEIVSNTDNAREAVVVPDAARDELRQLLRQEIDGLDDSDREVLLLHYFTGKSMGEIAVALDIGREAAKKRLQRARQQLSDNMLRHVGDETKPSVAFDKQRNVIAGLVALAAVPWGGAVAAAGFPLASAGATKLITVTGLAGLLIAGAAYVVNRQLRPEGPTAPLASSDMQQAHSDKANGESTSPGEVSSLPLPDAAAPEPAEVAADDQDTPAQLAGLWKLCDNLGGLADISVVQIVESAEEVTVYAYQNGASGDVLASGTLKNGDIQLPDVVGDNIPLLSGQVTDDDTFTVAGVVSEANSSAAIEITLTRLSDRDLAELEIQDRRMEEVETLAKALQAYVNANNGAKPATLAELKPTYLPASNLAESSPSRRIVYAPDGVSLLGTSWTEQYANLESHTEKLFKLEADRKADWWGFPSMPPLLSVQYSTPPMVLVCSDINRSGVKRTDRQAGSACSPPTMQAGALKGAATQASCANNMKQLGSVLKMFQAEDRESRFPAGWASTVPDYLTDTLVLTCPSLGEEDGPDRTVSYKLLFPTGTEEELIALYAEVNGIAEEGSTRAAAMANMPLIIEEHECSGSGGSQVLFLDGHVELITSDEWDTRIAPFAALSGPQTSIG